MIHIDLEIQAIQFFINSQSEFCSLLLYDSQQLQQQFETKIKCKCKEIQEINERIELDIQIQDCGNLILQFQQGKNLIGEAPINLSFYVENNLPHIADNLKINNQFDQQAQILVSLAWNQTTKLITQQQTVPQPIRQQSPNIRQQSPLRDSPIPIPQPQKPTVKKPADELHFDKRIVHTTYASWKDCQDKIKIEHEKKLVQPRVKSPGRFQTPKIHKIIPKQSNISSTGILGDPNNLELPIKDLRPPSKSPNGRDQRTKKKNDQYTILSPIEQSQIIKGTTKQPQEKNDQSQQISSRQLEKDIDQSNNQNLLIQQENTQLKLQVQKLSQENQILKEQIIKGEAAFNYLSETYTSLRNEYQKQQVKSFNNSSSHSLLNNKEFDQFKKELEQKAKEIDFYKKESEQYKKDYEINKKDLQFLQRENQQLQSEIQLNKGNIEILSQELNEKKRDYEQLEKELKQSQQAIKLIQSDSLKNITQFQANGNNQEMMEQMKNLIKTKQIELDNKNDDIKLLKQRINSLDKELGDQGRKWQYQIDNLKLQNSKLELENEKLHQEIQLKIENHNKEYEKTIIQHSLFLSNPELQNQQGNRFMNEYIAEIESLKQENQALQIQTQKDSVKYESIQKEFIIQKNIAELTEQQFHQQEKQIVELEKAVMNGKQNMADIINAVMELGGNELAEDLERYLITRRSTKVI